MSILLYFFRFMRLPFFIIIIFLGCNLQKSPSSKNESLANRTNAKDIFAVYQDSCIIAARLWLEKNNLPDLLERFEDEQKEKSEIDHSINYSLGVFVVTELSSSPHKFSVSYFNSSTDAKFLITWVVDFTVHRVYANPNEYGYDKEGVAF